MYWKKINTIETYYFKTYFQNARQCIKRMMHAKSLRCPIEGRFVPLNWNVVKEHKNVPRKMRVPYVCTDRHLWTIYTDTYLYGSQYVKVWFFSPPLLCVWKLCAFERLYRTRCREISFLRRKTLPIRLSPIVWGADHVAIKNMILLEN